MKTHLLFWPLIIIGVAGDLWTKHAVFQWLKTKPNSEFSIIDGFCKFVIRRNDGAAFSIASGRKEVLLIISIAALIAVVAIFLFGRIRRKTTLIALALFTAGIIGNLYDRIFNNGFVRDFIDIYYSRWHWPAFNAADSFLCIGVGLLIITNLTANSKQQTTKP